MNTTEGPNQGSLAVKHRKLCKYKKLSISLQVWFFFKWRHSNIDTTVKNTTECLSVRKEVCWPAGFEERELQDTLIAPQVPLTECSRICRWDMCYYYVSGLHSLQSREKEAQELWILGEGMGKRVLFICLLKCCLRHDCFLHLCLVSFWSYCPDPVYPQLFVLGNSLCCCTAK